VEPVAEQQFAAAAGDLAQRRDGQSAAVVDRPLAGEAAQADHANRTIEPVSEAVLTVPVAAATARGAFTLGRGR